MEVAVAAGAEAAAAAVASINAHLSRERARSDCKVDTHQWDFIRSLDAILSSYSSVTTINAILVLW